MSSIREVTNSAPLPNSVLPASARQTGGFTSALSKRLNVPSSLDSIFEEAAGKYQIPSSLLKAVGKAESNFNTRAVSRAGAQGIMQLMPGTAKSLGVSDSFDPRENIMGGAKYLSKMLQKYDGNVKLALAAYNAGSGNVDKYQGIPPFKETQNYVSKVMGYASGDLSAVPVRQPSGAGTQEPSVYTNYSGDAFYRTLLEGILNFDDYTSDDYMLFLEVLKSGLKTSDMTSFMSSSDPLYDSGLFSGRIQTLY